MNNCFISYDELFRRISFVFKRKHQKIENGKVEIEPSWEESINKDLDNYRSNNNISNEISLFRNVMSAYGQFNYKHNAEILAGKPDDKLSEYNYEEDTLIQYDNSKDKNSLNNMAYIKSEILSEYVGDFFSEGEFLKCRDKYLATYDENKGESFLMYINGCLKNFIRNSKRKEQKKQQKEISFDDISGVTRNEPYVNDSTNDESTRDILDIDVVIGVIAGLEVTISKRKNAVIKILYDYLKGKYECICKGRKNQEHAIIIDEVNETLSEYYEKFYGYLSEFTEEEKELSDRVYDYIRKYISDNNKFPNAGNVAKDVLGLNDASYLNKSHNEIEKLISKKVNYTPKKKKKS